MNVAVYAAVLDDNCENSCEMTLSDVLLLVLWLEVTIAFVFLIARTGLKAIFKKTIGIDDRPSRRVMG